MAYIFFFSDDFGLRNPVISGHIFAKKRYTSIVARVNGGNEKWEEK